MLKQDEYECIKMEIQDMPYDEKVKIACLAIHRAAQEISNAFDSAVKPDGKENELKSLGNAFARYFDIAEMCIDYGIRIEDVKNAMEESTWKEGDYYAKT